MRFGFATVGLSVAAHITRVRSSRHSMSTLVGHMSDLEGDYAYWQRYLQHSQVLRRDPAGQVQLNDNYMFVFGGDAIDRGPGDLRILGELVDLKDRHPDRVFLIMGNRDINKLRLPYSLSPAVLDRNSPSVYWLRHGTPEEVRRGSAESKLKWILSSTMGAPHAFEHRRAELQALGRAAGDEEVVASYLDMCAPSGVLTRYLQRAQVSLLLGDCLFVHGAVHDYNSGWVPASSSSAEEVLKGEEVQEVVRWCDSINAFARREVDAFISHSAGYTKGCIWEEGGGYEHPQPGSRLLQYGMGWLPDRRPNRSVIYSSYLTLGKLRPMGSSAAQWLAAGGVRRLLVGHQPHGDAPWVLDHEGVQVICGDNAYSANVQWPRRHLQALGLLSAVEGEVEVEAGGGLGGDFLTAHQAQGTAAPATSGGSTRSPLAYSEVLLRFPASPSTGSRCEELSVHGQLSDGSAYAFTLPDSEHNTVFGKVRTDGWMVKAAHVRPPVSSSGDLYLACHSDGHTFRNQLFVEGELLEDSDTQA